MSNLIQQSDTTTDSNPLSLIMTELTHLSSHYQFNIIIVTIIIASILFYIYWRLTRLNYPPGPRGFPILGVLPLLGKKNTHLKIQEWWGKYGDVMSFHMGSRRVVVVNGQEAMRECFVKKATIFEGRPENYLKKITRGKGLMFSEGDTWKEHRKFAITCLKEYGMGSLNLEEKVHHEIRYMLQELAVMETKPVDPCSYLSKAVSNIICSVVYGSRFEYNDEVFQTNLTALKQSVRKQTLISLVNFLPFLEFLPKILPTDRLLAKNVKSRDDYAAAQMARHRETFDVDNPRDFIDSYWAAMSIKMSKGKKSTLSEKCRLDNDDVNGLMYFTLNRSPDNVKLTLSATMDEFAFKDNLKRSMQDLFIAGTEPVTTTLLWAVLFMSIHPEVQSKVQEELDRTVGQGRLASTNDRPSLPYTEATVMECQRVGNIALFNVPRAATQDTTLMGYDIPKGTWVFANRWGLHMSPRYWVEPERFNPERFLDENGQVKRTEALYPYGMGTRSCVGESLARMELFLFFSALLQTFTFTLPDDSCMPDLEPQMGLNLSPKSYKVVLKCR